MDISDFKDLSPNNLWNSLISSDSKPNKQEKATYHLVLPVQKYSNQIIIAARSSSQDEKPKKKDWFNDQESIDCFFFEDDNGASSPINFLCQNQQNVQQVSPTEQLQNCKSKKVQQHNRILQYNDDIDPLLDRMLDDYTDTKNYNKHIFSQKPLKFSKKNTNVPKFIIRVFFKYFHTFNSIKNYKYSQVYKKSKQLIGTRKTNNFNIHDILNIFQCADDIDDEVGLHTREILAKILRHTKKQQLINNAYINTNIKSYMIATQIYSIRCRSKTLSQRVKIF